MEALDEARTIAERVEQSFSTPIHVAGHDVTVSVSLGIADGESQSAGSLLRHADIAMYRAKAAGLGQAVLYDTSMRSSAAERLQFESDLVGALERDEFRLVYQPVVALETEAVVGFEALLRWDHPTRGVLAPDVFIPIVEHNGLIVPIGRWVLDQACRTAARWRSDNPGARELTMAVNLSARQLARPELVNNVADTLVRTGLDPTALVLEMTETVLVQDPVVASTRLHELRALGVRLAIDDFGTGYSSLSYLRQFPVDILKIDRSFVNSIIVRGQIPPLVRGMLDLSRTLDLATIAEGVENDIQRDCLRDEHCGYAQGYLFSRPLDETDAEALLMQLEPGDIITTTARENARARARRTPSA